MPRDLCRRVLGESSWLEQQLQLGADPIQTQISQVVLILTFRCGLRRGEVFGLRLCDLHDQGGIYLHVRRYPGHRLKTPNSTRTLRIDVRVSARARSSEGGLPDATSLALRTSARSGRKCVCLLTPDSHRRRGLRLTERFRRVMQAVHAATGEHRLVIHHLRHQPRLALVETEGARLPADIELSFSSMPALGVNCCRPDG